MTEKERTTLNRRIACYWDRRAESYNLMRRNHLHGPEFLVWQTELKENLPKGKLKILDIGCGTGFISLVAASLGHEVTGIDLSPQMIMKSIDTAKSMHLQDLTHFQVANIEDTSYKDNSFDAIINRNTIWTLTDVTMAFEEIYRILKPGGLLLCYDSDYGKATYTPNGDETDDYLALMKECDSYKKCLPISKVKRPAWDIMALRNTGFVHCECRRNISGKFSAHGINNGSSALFALYAVKPATVPKLPSDDQFDSFYRHNQLFYREHSLFGNKEDSEYLVLDLLCRQPEGLRSSDIMEHFLIPKQTLTRIIAQMSKKNLIEQRKNPRDSRSTLLFATKEGYALHLTQTMERFELYSQILQNFPADKMKKLNELYMEFLNAFPE